MSSLSDVLKDMLLAEDINTVFGIPGGLIHSFFASVSADQRFDTYLAKHESGAVFMAQGSYLATGRVAVAAATAGPGATNMLTACASALKEGIPLVIITGMVAPFNRLKGASQETHASHIDVTSMFSEVTKFSAELSVGCDLVRFIEKAILMAKSGEPGPVHLGVPASLWDQPVAFVENKPSSSAVRICRDICNEDARELARVINASERPLFVVGNGVDKSSLPALEDFTVGHQIPVLNSPRAKNRYPEARSNCFGHIGLASFSAARHIVRDADTVVYFGCSMDETETYSGDPDLFGSTRVVQVASSMNDVGCSFLQCDLSVLGSPGQVIDKLCAERINIEPSLWRIDLLAADLKAEKATLLAQSKAAFRDGGSETLHPIRWRGLLSRKLEEGAAVFSDIGAHMLFNLRHIQLKPSNEFFLHLGFGSMTSGLLTAMGYAAHSRDRRVYAIVGDACFHMMGMELVTAAENEWPVTFIIENNDMHSITWHGGKCLGYAKPFDLVVNKKPSEIASIARGMGLNAHRVCHETELQSALEESSRQSGPCLIEIKVDGIATVPPLGDRAKAIAGFRND